MQTSILPMAFECRLKTFTSPLTRAICRVNFLQTQQREIGDHVLPRQQRAAKHTGFLEHVFSTDETQAALKMCKSRGVSINSAIIALCGAAWAKTRCGGVGVDRNIMPVFVHTLQIFMQNI
jgi:hypothetical protein